MFKQIEKVIFTVIILSCLLLTMSFVSADNVNTDNNGSVVTNNSLKSFNDLNYEINNDLNKTDILLNDDYFNPDEHNHGNFSEGIFINRSLTIDGQGHMIDANGASRIFFINADNIILKNIILKNGRSVMNSGAAIYCNASNIIIANVTFLNNHASFFGGAICCDGYNITVNGSTFIDNFAAVQGSAIDYKYGGVIINSTFINNYAIERNTLFNYTDSNEVINMHNESISYALNNSAYYDIIRCENEDIEVIIVNSTFKNTPSQYITDYLRIIINKNSSENNSVHIDKKIKKSSLKFMAKNKIFNKIVKIKKYSVFLSNKNSKPVKKVWVFLKIKGKIFKAKTNAKGKATFKITKLTKKGKYRAKIIFKGNTNYNQAHKIVKLILK